MIYWILQGEENSEYDKFSPYIFSCNNASALAVLVVKQRKCLLANKDSAYYQAYITINNYENIMTH